ncbi:hypothetical protein [Methanoregula sp.]|uniref:hypothetical protein n=1 Tax=Methanoregula sp. TaxID=2052170 RepID=UPI002CC12908|nr:hypothetical protein [Methanoregula sp.]HVP95856.1 hypothetical protein [Methanoregula sp.]
METDETQQRNDRPRHHRHRGFMLIPAGVLLGLGFGLIFSHAGAGVLIGLGLGFIGAALFPYTRTGPDANTVAGGRRGSGILALVGIFLTVIGFGVLWQPFTDWPVIAALFIILLGLWFLFRAFFPEK